ncbi:unnamed protein product [Rhizophagus irregularis]|nr:unnamed protein product [Rhizophagus irregularis]
MIASGPRWTPFQTENAGLFTKLDFKVRVGFRVLKNGKTKIRSDGLPKNENPRIKIRSGSDGLLKNENPRIKIRSGGLSCSEEWKNQDSLRWASDLWEKRNQDSFGGLPTFGKRGIKICSVGSEFRRTEKNQDSYLRILELQDFFFSSPFTFPSPLSFFPAIPLSLTFVGQFLGIFFSFVSVSLSRMIGSISRIWIYFFSLDIVR